MHPSILVKNRNTSGGTQVRGIGEPTLQLAERPLNTWNKTLAMGARALAVRTSLRCMQTPTVFLYAWATTGTLRVNFHLSLQVFLPRPNHLGSHTQIRARRRVPGFLKRHFLNKPTEPQEGTPEVIEPPGTPAPVEIQAADAIHLVQFGIFPKRLTLPYPDDEILSGYEEDALSIRDRYPACVKEVPDAILKHHLISVNHANPVFREAQDRRHPSTNPEYGFDNDVPNRSPVQKRLSMYNWNPGPRRGKEGAIEKHMAGKWHVITLQEATEYLEHEILTNHFYVTHYEGGAVLCKKDTSLGHQGYLWKPPRY